MHLVRALLVFSALWGCQSREQTAFFFAAASTARPAAVAADRFDRVQLSVASSAVLARQIEAGAPAAVFLSANYLWADRLDPIQRVDLLSNELVVISSKGVRPPKWDGAFASSIGRCLVLADPAYVPAGMYAKAALQAAGQWSAVKSQVISVLDAPAAVKWVERGECEVGLAYRTDALAANVSIGDRVSGVNPVYPLLLLRPSGQGLYDWLQSDEGQRVFLSEGFSRPR